MSDRHDPAPLPDGLDLPVAEWQQTPRSVRLLGLALLKRLEARMHQNLSNSSRPPSTDAPTTKRQRRRPAAERRKPGGKPGNPSHQQIYQSWQGLRQSCLAHLLRTAKRLTEHLDAGIARFGHRVHGELQRRCHMGRERPTVGQWRGWYARFHLS